MVQQTAKPWEPRSQGFFIIQGSETLGEKFSWLLYEGMAVRAGVFYDGQKREGRAEAAPTGKLILIAEMLLRSLGLDAVEGEGEARLVTVASVLVQHALGDGLIDRGHRRMEKIAGGGGVSGGDGGAQAAHQ